MFGFLEEWDAPQSAGAVFLVIINDFLGSPEINFFPALPPEWIVEALVEFVMNRQEIPRRIPHSLAAQVVAIDHRLGNDAIRASQCFGHHGRLHADGSKAGGFKRL